MSEGLRRRFNDLSEAFQRLQPALAALVTRAEGDAQRATRPPCVERSPLTWNRHARPLPPLVTNLRILRLYGCYLGDDGLGPLMDGLAVNTHLQELDCEARLARCTQASLEL